MGIRGIIKNVLTLYLGYNILKLAFTNSPPTLATIAVTIALIIFSLWFLAEKVGVLPQC